MNIAGPIRRIPSNRPNLACVPAALRTVQRSVSRGILTGSRMKGEFASNTASKTPSPGKDATSRVSRTSGSQFPRKRQRRETGRLSWENRCTKTFPPVRMEGCDATHVAGGHTLSTATWWPAPSPVHPKMLETRTWVHTRQYTPKPPVRIWHCCSERYLPVETYPAPSNTPTTSAYFAVAGVGIGMESSIQAFQGMESRLVVKETLLKGEIEPDPPPVSYSSTRKPIAWPNSWRSACKFLGTTDRRRS